MPTREELWFFLMCGHRALLSNVSTKLSRVGLSFHETPRQGGRWAKTTKSWSRSYHLHHVEYVSRLAPVSGPGFHIDWLLRYHSLRFLLYRCQSNSILILYLLWSSPWVFSLPFSLFGTHSHLGIQSWNNPIAKFTFTCVYKLPNQLCIFCKEV
jgi:hypothetical protein